MRCLPYQHAAAGTIALVDTHTVAVPVTNRRGEPCVALLDLKNRLELACHALPAVRTRQAA